MKLGRDLWWHDVMAARELGGLQAREARLRAPAVHPLHQRNHREAQGHPAHHRRLPDPRHLLTLEGALRPARTRTPTGARPTSGGSPGTATSMYGAARERRDDADVRGGARRYPGPDRFWDIIERWGVNIFYTAPTAIRTFMRLGATSTRQAHDLSSLRLLGTVGEPINPEAWMWYHEVIGGKRCPIVDTWWQTETGGIMITPLPGIVGDQARHRRPCPFPGIEADVLDEDGKVGQSSPDAGYLAHHLSLGLRHAARRCGATRPALPGHLLVEVARRLVLPRRRRQAATTTGTSGSWGVSTTC